MTVTYMPEPDRPRVILIADVTAYVAAMRAMVEGLRG